MISSPFIAIEWGTARVLARLITTNGAIVDRWSQDVELNSLERTARVEMLNGIRSRWPAAADTMWLAGMIGSPMGLVSVPQLPCPATPADIAGAAQQVQIDGLKLAVLPGLSCISRFGDLDVLRGEEVAGAGLSELLGAGNALLLSVPGMHGKWLELSQGRLARFHTSMTVEIYRALASRSILSPLMAAPACDGNAFRSGLARSAEGGGLARLLFSGRTGVMAHRFSEAEAASYLWGILIGADVGENLEMMAGRTCYVTGAADIAALFVAAINHLGASAEQIDNDEVSAFGFAQLRETMRIAESIA